MNSERLKQLERFVQEEPEDPFNHYALALEWLKSDRHQAAEMLATIIAKFPDYLASYYTVANLEMENDNPAKAQHWAEQGVAIAKRQQNAKALRELQALISQLADED